MAFSPILSGEFSEGVAILVSLWEKVRDNFIDHQNRINAVDGSSGYTDPGVILPYGGQSPPSGWFLCDGSAVSRAGFSALFSVIGTSFGAGDGSTTFNLPNLMGRTPIGNGAGSGLTPRSVGDSGGEEAHELSEAEIPSHNHTKTDAGHFHKYPESGTISGGYTAKHFTLAGSNTQTTGSNTTGITIENAGSGDAHETMQPWLCYTMVIKI